MILASNEIAKPLRIFVRGVKVGNFTSVSGEISKNGNGEAVGNGDIRAQTRQWIENLKHLLEAGGATLENVVKVTDMENLKAIHGVRAEYCKEKYPPSTPVEMNRLQIKTV